MEAILFQINHLQKKLGFMHGLFRGLNSPVEVYLPLRYPEKNRSALEQMRSDWERVGNDFRTVIPRAYGEASAEKPTESKPKSET